MANLNDVFTIHPRKRVARTPLYDWAGKPMPISLGEVYQSYSDAKYRAWSWWYNYCRELHGDHFCITSHNCNFFTISFDFPNPETGEMMRAIATGRSAHAYYIDPAL